MRKILLFIILLHGVACWSADPLLQDGASRELTEPQLEDTKFFLVQHADVPLYPVIAITAHMSGRVTLRVTVKAGEVIAVEPKASAASLMLVKAATDNVKTWRFWPEAQGPLEVTYVYELEKDESEFRRNPRIEMRLPTFVKIVATPTKPIVTPEASGGHRN
jgi:TonB family protein